MSDPSKERQAYFDECVANNWLLEHELDFSDCESWDDVEEAACKLLIDNFDIAHKGTYIREIIKAALAVAAEVGDAYD